MAEKLQVEIITPERLVLRGEAESLILPATEGYLGVLPRHAPYLAGLNVGVIRYRQGGNLKRVAVSGGFFEVNRNKVVVLADTAEKGEEIDIARARRAKERAERRLAERAPDLDVRRAEFALRRALARLRAAGEQG